MYKIASVLSYLVFNFSPIKNSTYSNFEVIKIPAAKLFLTAGIFIFARRTSRPHSMVGR